MNVSHVEPSMADELARVVDAIVGVTGPLEVILFGSESRGDATTDSDLDLLMVMPDGTHRGEVSGLIYRTLARVPGRTRAVDVVVTTPAQRERDRELTWSVVDTAGREGLSVYRRRQPVHG